MIDTGEGGGGVEGEGHLSCFYEYGLAVGFLGTLRSIENTEKAKTIATYIILFLKNLLAKPIFGRLGFGQNQYLIF